MGEQGGGARWRNKVEGQGKGAGRRSKVAGLSDDPTPNADIIIIRAELIRRSKGQVGLPLPCLRAHSDIGWSRSAKIISIS